MRITYVDIMNAMTEMITKAFQLPVHSDEVLEGFAMPCFFIKLVPVTTVEHKNVMRTTVSIVLTYFTDTRDELAWLDVQDKVRHLIQTGFFVANRARYIHVDDFSDTRLGEESDVLQIIITAWYYNPTQALLNRNDVGDTADTVELSWQNDTTEEKRNGLETFHPTKGRS